MSALVASEEWAGEAQAVRQEEAAPLGKVCVAEVEAWVENKAFCYVSALRLWTILIREYLSWYLLHLMIPLS